MPGPTVYIYGFSRFPVFFAIIQALPCELLIFLVCQFSQHIPSPKMCVSYFPSFSVFLAIFQVIECLFLILYVFQFSLHNPCSTVYFSFFTFFTIRRHCPGPTKFESHFPRSSVFLPYSRSYSECVSFSKFFSFLAIFLILHCVCFILLVCQCSLHIPGPTVCVSHFLHFSVFSPYSRSYSVHLSFFTFSVFIAIYQFLICEFLIFLVSQLSHHIPVPRVCISHFPSFSVFLAML